jgi:hypothetical protein
MMSKQGPSFKATNRTWFNGRSDVFVFPLDPPSQWERYIEVRPLMHMPGPLALAVAGSEYRLSTDVRDCPNILSQSCLCTNFTFTKDVTTGRAKFLKVILRFPEGRTVGCFPFFNITIASS